jgi:hypothetical protein
VQWILSQELDENDKIGAGGDENSRSEGKAIFIS